MTLRLPDQSGRPRLNTIAYTLVLVMLTTLSACTLGGNQSVSEANDQLRREKIGLESTIAALTGEKEELRVKLAESEHARGSNLPAEVLDAVSRCTGISIDSLSGFDPTDPTKPATGVTIHIQPRDGRGRFVPLVGTLRATALVLPASLDVTKNDQATLDRAVLGQSRVELSPTKLRDAYRSGLLGTAYAVELKFDAPIADRKSKLLLRVEFIDALTGQTHRAELVK